MSFKGVDAMRWAAQGKFVWHDQDLVANCYTEERAQAMAAAFNSLDVLRKPLDRSYNFKPDKEK